MLRNEDDLYAKLKELLLHFPTLRWIQKVKEGNKELTVSSEKIHAVEIPYFVVLHEFPRAVILHTENDGIKAREKVTEAKANSNNVLSWQKLHYLLNTQENLYMFLSPLNSEGAYELYILTLKGWTFVGIKTFVIKL